MPQFTPKPPQYEARPFNGGDESAQEIQGWLTSQNMPSDRLIPEVPEGEEVVEHIRFNGLDLEAGQWLMLKDGEFVILSASELYTTYQQTT